MRKQLILALALVFPFLLISQTVLIEGYVYETGNRGYLQQAAVTILDNATKAVKGNVFTDEAGVFKMGLPAGTDYLIRVEKKPFDTMEKVVSTTGKGEGDKVFVKYEMKRLPGYNFEVTLAPLRDDEDVVVDAIVDARIEVYNNTTEKEVLVIEKSTQHVFNVRFEQGNHYTILIRKDRFFNKRLEAYVNVKGCILCFDGVGDVKPGVADVLTEGHDMGTLLANVEMIPIEVNKEIEIRNIYYDYNSARIKTAGRAELDKLVVLLKDNDNLLVELGSHTDSRGETKYNQKLSQKRAQSVVDYLASKGVNKINLIAKGYGESKLVNRCKNGVECSESKHQRNRRTELKVVGFLSDKQYDNRSLSKMKEEEKFERMLAELDGSSEIKINEGEEIPDMIKNQKDRKEEVEEKMEEKMEEKVEEMKAEKPVQKIKETTSTNPQRPSGSSVQNPSVNQPTGSTIDTNVPKPTKKEKVIVHSPMPEKKEQVTNKIDQITSNNNASNNAQNRMESTDESEEFGDTGIATSDAKVVSELDVTSSRELKKPQTLSMDYTGYRVEFTTSLSELPVSHQIFSRHGNIVVEESKDGHFAYLLGDFEDQDNANDFLNNILIKRYPGARVIRYERGRRVVR